METYVVLLRGVMPMGKNKVPMADLRKVFTEAGFENVQTYIQTGNIIVSWNKDREELEQLVRNLIYDKIGADIKVIARTAKQFMEIIKNNPFENADTSKLYFTVLSEKPSEEKLKNFLELDFLPEQIRVINNTIYTLYSTKYSDSQFNNNFYEKKLKVSATTRNFNTMKKLAQLISII